jgi:hypothetical protein
MEQHDMTQPDVSTPKQNANTEPKMDDSNHQRRKPRRSKLRYFAFAVVALLACGGILYGVSSYLAPDIPEELTRSIKITPRNPGTSSETIDLPTGAITKDLTNAMIKSAKHPLDPVLEIAKRALVNIDENVQDYTAIMQKQVRLNGTLGTEGFMKCKIRHSRVEDGTKIPFSVYTYFLKPTSLAGQEAIWVKGANDGNLIAHAHGLLNFMRHHLNPTGALAMNGNLHPISNMGMRNLIVLLIEKGNRDRKHGECEVIVKRDVDVGGHACTLIEVTHPVERDHFEFHIARIYIDDARNLPIAYEGYLWP